MTMQRRRRQWTTIEPSGIQLLNTNSPAFLATDILANLGSDNDYAGHTVTRIIGHISCVSSAESSPSSVGGTVSCGLTVVPERLTTASAADAQIPDPSVSSSYEGDWWWRWTTPRIFSDPNNQPASLQWPYFPSSASYIPVDIRSSRRLRAGERASLVIAQNGWTTTHEPFVFAWLRALVLLP